MAIGTAADGGTAVVEAGRSRAAEVACVREGQPRATIPSETTTAAIAVRASQDGAIRSGRLTAATAISRPSRASHTGSQVSTAGSQVSAAGRHATDALALRLPILSGFAIRGTVLNFAHTLAVLLENGITTAEALRLAERTVANEALRSRFSEATDRVLEGESLSIALGRTGVFEPLLLDRLAVSEQTGSLAPGLRDIARTCRAQLDKFLNTFTTSISAGVLVAAFSFVAFIAYAIVSAVFKVSSSFRF